MVMIVQENRTPTNSKAAGNEASLKPMLAE
jgi:hypothetical protein